MHQQSQGVPNTVMLGDPGVKELRLSSSGVQCTAYFTLQYFFLSICYNATEVVFFLLIILNGHTTCVRSNICFQSWMHIMSLILYIKGTQAWDFTTHFFGLISCLGCYRSGVSTFLKNKFTNGRDNGRFRSLRASQVSAEWVFFGELGQK